MDNARVSPSTREEEGLETRRVLQYSCFLCAFHPVQSSAHFLFL